MRKIVSLIAVLFALLLLSSCIYALNYQITDLSAAWLTNPMARAVNDSGLIAGDRLGTPYYALLWENQIPRSLNTTRYSSCAAYAINTSGTVAGVASDYNSFSPYYAAYWDANGIHILYTTSGYNSLANGINDSNDIVGVIGTASGQDHAVIWDNNDPHDLGTLGGAKSGAEDINNDGLIVGSADTLSGESHATMWINGTPNDLGTLGGSTSDARAINNSGLAVGIADTSEYDSRNNSIFHACLWDVNGIHDLGTLGGTNYFAYDINDNEQIVGGSMIPSDNLYSRAFIWQNGVMKDLDTLIPQDSGWTLWTARGINNNGLIIGNGIHNGVSSSFLLTPVPEPSSLSSLFAFSISMVLAGLVRRKRRM